MSSWQAQGFSSVQLSRVFTDAATGAQVTASMNLLVPAVVTPPPVSVSAIISASPTPAQFSLVATTNNTLRLTWRVTADPAHQGGVFFY
ncbi:hypothetical protein [Oceanicoccus sp. KOV_DT_Chl]|uniref:hypothetical protein n=1 Tax=Oceanicoccus sp. KOV_DT_Chl TaxID=1904639 RepID=UPI000C7D7E7D|nr:hypothetical protein [Oceanicoccus sp. KOV_DT_Chl]